MNNRNQNVFQCWLSADDRVVSFRPVAGYVHRIFADHDEFMRFVTGTIEELHYRVQ